MNRRLRRTLQLAKWLAVCAIAVVLTLAAAIQIDQRLMRRDAEALLGDLRKLQVGVTTQAEAQRILLRWPQAEKSQRGCQRHCMAVVVRMNLFRRHSDFFTSHSRWMRLYTLLGGQMMFMRVVVEFVDGVSESDSFGIYLYVAPYHDSANTWSEYTLMGGASFLGSRYMPHHSVGDKFHPTYTVGPHGGCDGCLMINVEFLQGASSADVNRLMQFDLSCLNRWWHPCRTQADLMPAAWQQFLQDEARR
jgi:hypothetical protein